MNQLAAAQEQQLIQRGCQLRITVETPHPEDETLPSSDQSQHSPNPSVCPVVSQHSLLRLQILSKGGKQTLELKNIPSPEKVDFEAQF